MSVTLSEVLANAGYDIKNNPEDAKWLLAQDGEWNELFGIASDLQDEYDDYLDCKDTAEEDGDYNYPSFEEWRKDNGNK